MPKTDDERLAKTQAERDHIRYKVAQALARAREAADSDLATDADKSHALINLMDDLDDIGATP